MTTLSWDAVTTNCAGSPTMDLAYYEVLAYYEASALDSIGTTEELFLEFPLSPAPGQVLYMRVRAWDFAGNNSDDCDGCSTE